MSLLSSVLNKITKAEEPKASAAATPSFTMDPREMSQRFAQFVMIQAQNILLMLGKIPTPDGEMYPPNFESAKIFIDQLEMIQEKTKGNLTPQESALLEKAMTQVKLAFVESTGGTPHTMMPNRPMPEMPAMEEEKMEEEPQPPMSQRRASAPEAPSSAPVEPPAPAENKKKFVKKYG